jgi:hypothetical protein
MRTILSRTQAASALSSRRAVCSLSEDLEGIAVEFLDDVLIVRYISNYEIERCG